MWLPRFLLLHVKKKQNRINTNQHSHWAEVHWSFLLLYPSLRIFQISAKKSLIFSDASPLAYECFWLRYLNCSSFIVNALPVCFFLFFFSPPTGQQERLLRHYKGNVLKGRRWGQLNLTTQSSPLWHSWAVDISTSFLIFVLMEMLPGFCVCMCVWAWVCIDTKLTFFVWVDCVPSLY